MKKLVGQVTTEEKNEIQQLFERRNGLNELAKILNADNVELYEKLVKDMGETGTKFQGWWDRMAQKYQWESAENGNWEINFETNDIYLAGVALLIFGGKKVPELMKGLGKGVQSFKQGMNEPLEENKPEEVTDDAQTESKENDEEGQ